LVLAALHKDGIRKSQERRTFAALLAFPCNCGRSRVSHADKAAVFSSVLFSVNVDIAKLPFHSLLLIGDKENH
jgi:hypothetical protein